MKPTTQLELEKYIFDTNRDLIQSFIDDGSLEKSYELNAIKKYLEQVTLNIKGSVKKSRKNMKYVSLTDGIKADSLASVAIMTTLSECMRYTEDTNVLLNVMCLTIGKRIEKDLTNDDWDDTDRMQVGAWLIGILIEENFIKSEKQHTDGKTNIYLELTDDVLGIITKTNKAAFLNNSLTSPCIERPLDWTSLRIGGFHSSHMKRYYPTLIKPSISFGSKEDYYSLIEQHDLTQIMKSANILQGTAWRVNRKMFHAIEVIAQTMTTDEIVNDNLADRPAKPAFMQGKVDIDSLTDEQLAEMEVWKKKMHQWHVEGKSQKSKFLRYHTIMKTTEFFKDYPELYFVFQCDFRGRFYATSRDITMQGSDLNKSLLELAHGRRLVDDNAVKWFLITGANRFGVDKVSFEDRVQWVVDHHEDIILWASDPTQYTEWTKASKQLQFLAWCMEYSDWYFSPETFESHIVASVDATASGIQHYAAILRDDVAGSCVNLVNSDKPNDIYADIAKSVYEKLLTMPDSDYKDMWIQNGIPRELTKRPIMTLPYGCTRYSVTDFILEDYIRRYNTTIPKEEQIHAAMYIGDILWGTMDDKLTSSIKGMETLQKSVKSIFSTNLETQHISWVTPSGFPVYQCYKETKQKRVRVNIFGKSLSVYETTKNPDKNRNVKGIAPNMIHSMDASHLAMTLNASYDAFGITDFSMIHDDFGCHPCDMENLFWEIRRQFVRLYTENNPISDFLDKYNLKNTTPVGNLDLSKVIDSQYMFS